MKDLIERQAAIKKVQAYHCRYPEYMDGFVSKVLSAIKADLVEDIEEMPTVEPKTGRWMDTYNDGDWHCSECGAIVEKDEQIRHNWQRCYHCGAKMEGNQDATD